MIKTLLVGRNKSCDFVLHDKYASREHLQLVVNEEEQKVFLVDLGSKSGTTIDGHLVKSMDFILLEKHNIVRAGDSLVPWDKIVNNEFIITKPMEEGEDLLSTTFDKITSKKTKKKPSFFKTLFGKKNN